MLGYIYYFWKKRSKSICYFHSSQNNVTWRYLVQLGSYWAASPMRQQIHIINHKQYIPYAILKFYYFTQICSSRIRRFDSPNLENNMFYKLLCITLALTVFISYFRTFGCIRRSSETPYIQILKTLVFRLERGKHISSHVLWLSVWNCDHT